MIVTVQRPPESKQPRLYLRCTAPEEVEILELLMPFRLNMEATSPERIYVTKVVQRFRPKTKGIYTTLYDGVPIKTKSQTITRTVLFMPLTVIEKDGARLPAMLRKPALLQLENSRDTDRATIRITDEPSLPRYMKRPRRHGGTSKPAPAPEPRPVSPWAKPRDQEPEIISPKAWPSSPEGPRFPDPVEGGSNQVEVLSTTKALQLRLEAERLSLAVPSHDWRQITRLIDEINTMALVHNLELVVEEGRLVAYLATRLRLGGKP